MGSLRGTTRRWLGLLVIFSILAMSMPAVAQDLTDTGSNPSVEEGAGDLPPVEDEIVDPPPVQQQAVDPGPMLQGPVDTSSTDEGTIDPPPVENQAGQELPDEVLPATTVVLLEPSLQPDSCLDGVYTAASVWMSDDGVNPAVTYQISAPDGTGQWSVLATLQPGYAWGDLSGTSWVILDASQAVASGIVTITPCEPVSVEPESPVIPEETAASPTAPVSESEAEASPTADTSVTPDASTPESAPQARMSISSVSILAASCGSAP
jgi:hypothetical protein